MEWKHITMDGVEWEVRAVSSELTGGEHEEEEVLEFRTRGATLPPRRLSVRRGVLDGMDEAALRSAFLQARPIGGDFYGRPGKRMTDAT